MLVATFRSSEMRRDTGEGSRGETGFFEFSLHVERKLLDADPDPRGLLLRLMAQTAADLVRQHGLPLFLWSAEIDPRVQAATNLPPLVDFK